ncbi:MAG: hypothetical protein CMA77_00700 [Euryarchaeota archaeon]|nr:hypothetical protein [Euryarchaeota archaeon]
MQYNATERMNLPALRSNPFDIRPLNRKQMELMVGREELFQALANNIRFISPRVVAVIGEKGSGRSSLIQTVAATTEHVHTVFWPEKDHVTTILHQMYCDLMNDFETSPVHSVLIDRLEEELAGNSGQLPVIIFDHPHLSGTELSEVLTNLMPVLSRIRALTLISLTPGQKSGFSEELLSEMDVTPPLEPFSRDEIISLISKRVQKASHSSWTAPTALIDKVMEESGGHIGRAMRFLRDFVDHTRGMPLADGRKFDMKFVLNSNPPTEVEDSTFQRVVESAPLITEVDVEISEVTFEGESAVKNENSDIEDSDDGDEMPSFPSFTEAADIWTEYENGEEIEEGDSINETVHAIHESEQLEKIDTEEIIDEKSVDLKQEFSDIQGGAEMLEMHPGSAPSSGGGRFGSLRSRNKAATIGIEATQRGAPAPSTGPMEARPNENEKDPNQLHQVETNDRNVALWVQEGVDSPLPKDEPRPEPVNIPLSKDDAQNISPIQDESMNQVIIDEADPQEVLAAISNMRRVAPPVEPTVTLDINELMNLNAGEMLILEQAIEREISPSDELLQQELLVGRPRLSQIFNRLLKNGILTARKQGRSRLFRISAPAKDHLVNLGSGGE